MVLCFDPHSGWNGDFEVEEVTLHERIKSLHAAHPHMPKVKNLPVEALTADAAKVYNALHTFCRSQ